MTTDEFANSYVNVQSPRRWARWLVMRDDESSDDRVIAVDKEEVRKAEFPRLENGN
jgi:inorganic pyrophosphatase